MNAVPLALKRAIGAGIGLFILFIGFVNGGLIVSTGATSAPSTRSRRRSSFPTTPAQFVFLFGLALTIVLWARKIQAALVISILVTTIVALAAGVAEDPGDADRDAGVLDARRVRPRQRLHASLPLPDRRPHDLRDHADRLLRHDGHGHRRRGRGRPRRTRTARSRGVGRVLLVDSVAAAVGGLGRRRPRTRRYIESAAGVAEGGQDRVRVGRDRRPVPASRSSSRRWPGSSRAWRRRRPWSSSATSCSRQVKDINVGDIEDGLPALLDHDPHAADVRHHGRHRRRLHHAGSSSRSSRAR